MRLCSCRIQCPITWRCVKLCCLLITLKNLKFLIVFGLTLKGITEKRIAWYFFSQGILHRSCFSCSCFAISLETHCLCLWSLSPSVSCGFVYTTRNLHQLLAQRNNYFQISKPLLDLNTNIFFQSSTLERSFF